MVSSASQSPVSTSIGPPSTISRAAEMRSPKKPLQLAMRSDPGAPAGRVHARLHGDEEVVDVHLLPRRAVDGGHGPGAVGPQRVLHLHGLEHDEAVALGHRLADGDEDLGDGARQRRAAFAGHAPALVGVVFGAQGEGRLALRPAHVRPVGRVPHPVAPAQPVLSREVDDPVVGARRAHLVPRVVDEHPGRLAGRRGAHLHRRPRGVRQVVRVERMPDVAPARRGHGTRLRPARSSRRQKATAAACRRRTASGRPRVAQVGAALEVVDVDVAAPEGRIVEHGPEELAVGLEAVELERAQRQGQPPDGRRSILAAGHELGDQRVVGRADHAPRLDGAVGAQAGPFGPAHVRDGARRRPVVLPRAFGAQPDLHGVPGDLDLRLGEGQGAARRHRQLQADQVEAGDQLGDPVLDLQPGVHLQEVEPVRVDQVLHRADADVGDRLRCGDGRVPHLPAGRRRHEDGGRLLDDLLVPALHRALPVEQVEHAAMGVPDDLDLDMAGGGQVPLQEDLVGAERGLRPPAAPTPRRRPARRARRTSRIPRPPPPADAFTRSG